MPPRGGRRRTGTVTYNLNSAGSRAAFEEGLDFHDEYDDSDAAGCNPSILGSSPGTSSSMLPSRRSALPVFSAGYRSSDSHHHGALLKGQGSERQTVEFLNLLELFPRTDRLIVEEVFSGCDHSFDRALETLSEMQDPHDAWRCGSGADDGGTELISEVWQKRYHATMVINHHVLPSPLLHGDLT